MDRQRLRPHCTDGIQNKSDGINVIEMGMRDKHMINQRQFWKRELTNAGSGVYKNILINQERRRTVLLSANAAGAAEYAKAHVVPSLRIYQWRPQARGTENSVLASRQGAHAALSQDWVDSDFNPKRRRF
jgi:hypothetical protein